MRDRACNLNKTDPHHNYELPRVARVSRCLPLDPHSTILSILVLQKKIYFFLSILSFFYAESIMILIRKISYLDPQSTILSFFYSLFLFATNFCFPFSSRTHLFIQMKKKKKCQQLLLRCCLNI